MQTRCYYPCTHSNAASNSAAIPSPDSAPPPAQKLLLTVADTAEQLSLGQTKVRELIRRGELRAIKVDAALRVPASAVEQWIEEHLNGHA